MWQTKCTIGILNADVAIKIKKNIYIFCIKKMPRQYLNLKKMNLSILTK